MSIIIEDAKTLIAKNLLLPARSPFEAAHGFAGCVRVKAHLEQQCDCTRRVQDVLFTEQRNAPRAKTHAFAGQMESITRLPCYLVGGVFAESVRDCAWVRRERG